MKIIKLTRIRQWYIVADADSYLTLKSLGVCMTRFHQDFLPTLKLLTDKHDVRGKEVNFKTEILGPFLDRVGNTWLKKHPSFDCTIDSKTMTFEVRKADGYDTARKTIPKMEEVLSAFFARWGYRSSFEYSEARGKCRFAVEYWFDPERQPIVVLAEDVREKPKVMLKFGNLRLTLTFDDPRGAVQMLRDKSGDVSGKRVNIGYVHVGIEISQGGNFVPFHSTRCTYQQISNVKPMIAALMEIPNVHANNFDEKPE
jgi:hypothetical protein